MSYSTFSPSNHDATREPMFFGRSVNVARYDKQKYPIFEKLIEKQLSFFWRPEEVDLTNDRKDFMDMPDHEKHIFLSNLKYQTLLDSVQGRSPNVAFLPVVSLPELETWFETWAFSETIHSRSYTHIIRNIITEPAEVFDTIVTNPEIIKRAETVTRLYDEFIQLVSVYSIHGPDVHLINGERFDATLYNLKTKLYLTLVSVNVLEAIRFYVSFACSFAFAERALMEGNAKIIKLIARDEALHLTGTQHMLNLMASGTDDPDFKQIAVECEEQVYEIFREAAEQEKEWAGYLFSEGSMIGLNARILGDYVEYITNVRMKALGLNEIFPARQNPLPWMNGWLVSDNVQVAPQEAEISSYLVGQIDNDVGTDDFDGFDL
ncbi:MAG: ribonucleotide-diphosphate reductase subunit beta [Oceanospirillales bacterium]|uniref:ribonucleoside-diphosphate reductase n=1 Tax=Marinobacterium halophilum TaxID=267374 RepID=A0A2P8F4X0_9GAMM|nr:class Ia ribonucleoside-diphosphate reductase subunit beta [Marinobacterium halophilum]MBR9828770.1 ribonucleotide-diphosphate reductase subunit beta [Oceanospirillales bacterium]PSL16757.1 ribonucleoside-diphosphate reductase class Ia beta subunit [Marinobacterium halophilum]